MPWCARFGPCAGPSSGSDHHRLGGRPISDTGGDQGGSQSVGPASASRLLGAPRCLRPRALLPAGAKGIFTIWRRPGRMRCRAVRVHRGAVGPRHDRAAVFVETCRSASPGCRRAGGPVATRRPCGVGAAAMPGGPTGSQPALDTVGHGQPIEQSPRPPGADSSTIGATSLGRKRQRGARWIPPDDHCVLRWRVEFVRAANPLGVPPDRGDLRLVSRQAGKAWAGGRRRDDNRRGSEDLSELSRGPSARSCPTCGVAVAEEASSPVGQPGPPAWAPAPRQWPDTRSGGRTT
jgi:hypothetical protein